MNLVEKAKRGVVSVARASEFFGFEEGLHDSGVEVEPLGVFCEGYECRGELLVRGVECFEVRGEVFKGAVAHVSNRSPPEDVGASFW